MSIRSRQRQGGATAVEFALVMLLFLTFMLGILDFTRMLFTWNAAAEATRDGARYAVVCDDTSAAAAVVARMRGMLPQLAPANVQLRWTPPTCDPSTCEGVTVAITGLNYRWISPIVGMAARNLPMPSFSTYLPRERMRQDPHSATLCGTP